ncbi:MAG: tetratricopeptide repeat protein [Cyanobacteria bacterium HKST-UBA06]|nr:tetratricopeptide repeat protein [Cyanobacteria bacterium HKST-UBA06]
MLLLMGDGGRWLKQPRCCNPMNALFNNLFSKLMGRGPEHYFDKAVDAFHAHQFAKALELFNTYEELSGDGSVALYYNKAQCYEGMEEWKEAEDTYRYCIEAVPEDPEAQYMMGRFYYDRGEPEKALQHLVNANAYSDQHQGDVDALSVLGFVYEDLQDPEQAIATYEKVLSLDRNLMMVRIFLSNLYIRMKKLDKAREYLPRPEEIDATDVDLNLELATTYGRLGSWPDTKTCCHRALQIDERNAQVYNQLGLAHYCCHEYDKAVEHYQKALEIDPSYDIATNNLAYTFEKMDRFEDAIRIFNQYLILVKNDPQEASDVKDHIAYLVNALESERQAQQAASDAD